MRVLRYGAAVCALLSAPAFPVLAEDVACRFKADTDRTEVTIVYKGEPRWRGTLDKNQVQTVPIPEGPFTVHSKVFNPNLQTQGAVRTDAHTKMCRDDVALSVPLFPDEVGLTHPK